MRIWVDADACPLPIKEIIFRAAVRRQIVTTLVSNHPLNAPKSPYIKRVQVSSGFDVADQYIVNECVTGDLVITADIPLADLVVAKGAIALNPRGTLYTAENIKQRLSVRNLHDELRSSGVMRGGPPALSKREIETFANYLNQYLH